jgi:hypothetical protein
VVHAGGVQWVDGLGPADVDAALDVVALLMLFALTGSTWPPATAASQGHCTCWSLLSRTTFNADTHGPYRLHTQAARHAANQPTSCTTKPSHTTTCLASAAQLDKTEYQTTAALCHAFVPAAPLL